MRIPIMGKSGATISASMHFLRHHQSGAFQLQSIQHWTPTFIHNYQVNDHSKLKASGRIHSTWSDEECARPQAQEDGEVRESR